MTGRKGGYNPASRLERLKDEIFMEALCGVNAPSASVRQRTVEEIVRLALQIRRLETHLEAA